MVPQLYGGPMEVRNAAIVFHNPQELQGISNVLLRTISGKVWGNTFSPGSKFFQNEGEWD